MWQLRRAAPRRCSGLDGPRLAWLVVVVTLPLGRAGLNFRQIGVGPDCSSAFRTFFSVVVLDQVSGSLKFWAEYFLFSSACPKDHIGQKLL